MSHKSEIQLSDVQAVYSGPEADLWNLVMGRQIHIGGMRSSEALAHKAEIQPGSEGVDLCCCSGAGMRFLIRFRDVAKMHGVDATQRMLEWGKIQSEEESFTDQTIYLNADACETGLPDASFDFAWGEDAWCYVVDKPALIAEAVRLVKPGGIVAFTDWIEGPTGLTDEEADRFLRFMKFPNVETCDGYVALLKEQGCEIIDAQDTGRFLSHIDLYLQMLDMQLTYDALRIIGFDTEVFAGLAGEMVFMQGLAHAGKIAQGQFVARKPE
jgi:ubiquinone/menaquinone biosynthesis C-methylase UbiE